MARLGIINITTNLCENIVEDARPIEEIYLPESHMAINLDITPTVLRSFNASTNEWLEITTIGAGGIGYTWDGEKLIQPYM